MYDITLLSSFHIQQGNCNSHVLFNIIEELQPEIIFEELPEDLFQIIYSDEFEPQSLEAITVKKYVQKYNIQHFPVDTLDKDMDNMFDSFELIAKKNDEYANLFQQHIDLINHNGFNYLNSHKCMQLIERIHKLELSTLMELNIPLLTNQYVADMELDNEREFKMVKNIYKLSKGYPYQKAVFICGAQHRKPVIQIIREFQRTAQIKLNWNFD